MNKIVRVNLKAIVERLLGATSLLPILDNGKPSILLMSGPEFKAVYMMRLYTYIGRRR